MCGIAGIVDRSTVAVDVECLRAMFGTLAHRGPDDEGLYGHGSVGLGHRRLSILDPTPLGHQPMSNPDETIWITYNGEVYNFNELRAALRDPRPYRSHTWQEVHA